MTNIVFVPFCPVLLQPWAMPPKFAWCSLPYFGHCQVMHQFFVDWNCATGDRVHHRICIMFKINWDFCVLLYIVLNEACSHIERTLMACCVTRRCCMPLGRDVCIALGLCHGWTLVGCAHCCSGQGLIGAIRVMGSITQEAGMTPGVLLHVNHWCSQGVVFNTRLAVGFLNFMMGWASVMQGIVIMGVSSITLCSASRASSRLALFTLCSSKIGGGVDRLLIKVMRSLSRRLPLRVLLAWAVYLVNSSVKVQKCWWRVNKGNWSQIYDKPLFLKCNNCQIGNNLLKGQDIMCPHLGADVTIFVHHRFAPKRGKQLRF